MPQRNYESVGLSDWPKVPQLSGVAHRAAMLHGSVNCAPGDGFVGSMVVLAADIGRFDF